MYIAMKHSIFSCVVLWLRIQNMYWAEIHSASPSARIEQARGKDDGMMGC